MIDFEEELENFKPSLEVEQVEDAVMDMDLTDMSDILMKLIEKTQGREV